MPFFNIKRLLPVGLVLVVFGLSACSDNDTPAPPPPPPPAPPPAMATLQVTVTNLTNAQPLSPIAVVAHSDGFQPFTVGMPASAGLEMLAESGDNAEFLNEAMTDPSTEATVAGTGPIAPGMSETVSLTVPEASLPNLQMSVMTMLVNTNDAISGVNAAAIDVVAVGDTQSSRSIAYDAGTEANTETALTIPGPAGGGEGFNAARDDRADIVTMHSGVVGSDDGFATSDLSQAHRFDNPVMQVTLTRTQ